MINKVCTKCHVRKSADSFNSDLTKSDKKYPSCKDCVREQKGQIKRPDWHGKIVLISEVQCRWCQGCKKYLDCDLFYRRKNARADTRCKDCVLFYRGSEKYHLIDKKRREKLKLQIVSHYSNNQNCCACCGEKEIKFLSLDHIEGGGNRHRKELGNGHIYSVLRKQNYPVGYQILCHNCNLAKGFYGQCPHKNEKDTKKNA